MGNFITGSFSIVVSMFLYVKPMEYASDMKNKKNRKGYVQNGWGFNRIGRKR